VAARAAAERATPEDFGALQEMVALMDRALATDAHEHWAELNTRFHATISRLTAMPMLQDMMERVLDRWDRVRRFFFAGVLVHRAQQAQKEHHALLEAMRSRDWERLQETIRAHNRGALADYTAFLESRPVQG
jgi:DNA-binding GntR family transcriptional regulator